MSYRNKTYVAFASEDIHFYYLMEAWRDNKNIDFNFFDAHDLFISRDTSMRETIKRNLRERLKIAKQVVLIGSENSKRKGSDGYSFLSHEIDVIKEFNLPVIIANTDGGRKVNTNFIPTSLSESNYYTLSVSLQPAIVKYALNDYYPVSKNRGAYCYSDTVYKRIGI